MGTVQFHGEKHAHFGYEGLRLLLSHRRVFRVRLHARTPANPSFADEIQLGDTADVSRGNAVEPGAVKVPRDPRVCFDRWYRGSVQL